MKPLSPLRCKPWPAVLLLAAVLGGCATQPPVPVDRAGQAREPGAPAFPAAAPPVATATVRKGDTLYAIAFARGLDFHDIARWNDIGEPYTIYPGQVLRLGPAAPEMPGVPAASPAAQQVAKAARVTVVERVPAPTVSTEARKPVFVPLAELPPSTAAAPPAAAAPAGVAPAAPAAARGPARVATAASPAAAGGGGPARVATAAAPAASPAAAGGGGPARVATAAPTAPPAAAGGPARVATAAPRPEAAGAGTNPAAAGSERREDAAAAPGARGWQWPTDGKVLEAFGAGGRKGVVVGGSAGQTIRTARAGEVVYAGGGLLGYGLLVIVKHDDTYLSAYGNNSRLLVKEGVRVEAGQGIAEMGASADGRVGLHFELRRKGQPIDPLTLVKAP